MKLRGLGRVKRIAGKVRQGFRPGALILLYHRVADLPSDPQWLAVSPKNFDAQLEVIRQAGVPLTLANLAESVKTNSIRPKSIVVTFDDGSADNLLQAKPLLSKHDVPATVFVSTGYVKNRREYWWDEVERLILQSDILPLDLSITASENTFSWHLATCQQYSEDDQNKHQLWNTASAPPPSERHRLYEALINFLLPLLPDERWECLDELWKWAGRENKTRNTHRPLTADEIKQLSADGLVEIGAHTVSHSKLSNLPRGTQEFEIQQSKKDLEEMLERRVRSFAYPFGTLSDYTEETVELVKKSGFDYACSNFKDAVMPGADMFQLPRVIVRNWGRDEFASKLNDWLRS